MVSIQGGGRCSNNVERTLNITMLCDKTAGVGTPELPPSGIVETRKCAYELQVNNLCLCVCVCVCVCVLIFFYKNVGTPELRPSGIVETRSTPEKKKLLTHFLSFNQWRWQHACPMCASNRNKDKKIKIEKRFKKLVY